jgi:hypothetical protein
MVHLNTYLPCMLLACITHPPPDLPTFVECEITKRKTKRKKKKKDKKDKAGTSGTHATSSNEQVSV